MAVKFFWSTTVIIAISAGGAGIITTVALIVFLVIRFRKKRRLGRSQAARVRRLSRYPGGNLSLTGSEVDRLPSFRSVRHGRFSRGPYGVLGWSRTAESQDTLSRRSCLSNTSRATATATVSRIDVHKTPSAISWPIQPPAAQTQGYTAPAVKALPLSPITERHFGNKADTPVNKVASQKLAASGIINDRCDDQTSDTNRTTRPIINDPLRAHRISTSDGFLDIVKREDDGVPKSDAVGSNQLQETSQRPARRRTLSLHSQSSGHVPTHRPKSPPPEIPRYSRMQPLRSHPANNGRRTSTASFDSTSSSLYEDDVVNNSQYKDAMGSFSGAGDASAMALAYGVPPESLMVLDSGKPLESKLPSTEAINSAETSTSAISRSQSRSNQFLRSNTRHRRVRRSPSSGLTPSLVDQHGPSRNVSNASHFEMANKNTSRSTGPNSPQSPIPNGGNNRDLPPQRHDDESLLGLGEAIPVPASSSILQDISSNIGSLSAGDTTRFAIDEPFKWDMGGIIEPGKPSALKDRNEGHKRQSRQRISFQPPSPGSNILAAMPEERSEITDSPSASSDQPDFFVTAPEYSTSPVRPPSVLVFEPQLAHNYITQRRQQKPGGDYSATLSVYNMYTGAGSSEELDCTPTRKPSTERAHYRQSRFIHNGDDTNPPWPLRGSSQFETQLPPSNNTVMAAKSNTLQIPPLDAGTFEIFAPRFHDPQGKPPEFRLPGSRGIRGPRAAPPRRTPTGRSPHRQSPFRQAAKPSSSNKRPPVMKPFVQELRRANSEISDTDAMSKFLMVGDTTPLPGTPELGDEYVFETPRGNVDPSHVDKRRTGLGISNGEDWSPKGEAQKSQKSRLRT
ncbi:hypothetical protein MMC30_005189 [Trapelia coarctata]|nr:hypothetical protein [Trapelia coarctata]